jgi:hypothetical protein
VPKKRKAIERTVQFWRLVDGRDGSTMAHVDRHAEWVGRAGVARHTIDGVEMTGTVYVPPSSEGDLIALVIASEKDYVPRQQDDEGQQAPMRLDGEDWDPVDNTFVLFLPFGNMFAVLTESTSSTRASMFVRWLNLATGYTARNGEFFWNCEPVIDPDRAQLLQRASGLRKLEVTGRIGSSVTASRGVFRTLRGAAPEQLSGWSVKIEITRVPGVTTQEDEAELLELFQRNFGTPPQQGDRPESRLTVTTAPDDVRERPEEIDLIHHRITRKARVQMADLPGRSFDTAPAVDALVKAFHEEEKLLSDLARRLERAG